ncbi:MAG TPA: PAS domain-containing sensor histidine kinase, partial [Methanocellaceae archaeon]
HGEPIKDGSGIVIKMYGTNQDITERVRTEEALRANDVRFRSLIQNASDIIRILDRNGRIVYDSPSSEKILGYPPGYMIGRFPFEFIHPDDLKHITHDLGEVYDSKNPGIPSEFRIRKANGEYLDVEAIGVNMIGVPGVDGIVVTTRPITERKRAEKELMDAKMQAELYLDLMGHDISNMHQVAIGQLELAKDIIKMDGKLEAEDGEMIDASLGSLWRSAKLIDNVRKLQKIRSDEVKNKEISLDGMLSGIVNQYAGEYPEKAIKIDVGEGPHIVKANELLRDVFTNLVGNAIKHSNGTNIGILVKLEDIHYDGKNYYKVSIEDNGPGVPEDMKDKIFNRLQRGETKARGMGLGLYLVRSLVESYNGKVWVEDRIQGNYAKGSRFVVMLPAIDKLT